ncbi:MAG TPA: hypothetical protein VM055_07995 [Novosphingobium sp.]|nr:hypothetical protein [Novosphingobium sp.]
MSQPQPQLNHSTPDGPLHLSTHGCVVDHVRWESRRHEAAELVRLRYLTLREASEQFALPVEEILSVH